MLQKAPCCPEQLVPCSLFSPHGFPFPRMAVAWAEQCVRICAHTWVWYRGTWGVGRGLLFAETPVGVTEVLHPVIHFLGCWLALLHPLPHSRWEHLPLLLQPLEQWLKMRLQIPRAHTLLQRVNQGFVWCKQKQEQDFHVLTISVLEEVTPPVNHNELRALITCCIWERCCFWHTYRPCSFP